MLANWKANSNEEMKNNKAFNVKIKKNDYSFKIFFYLSIQVRKRYQSDLPTGKAAIEMKYELKVCLQRKLLPNPKYCLVIDAGMIF